ncbi:MAG TPA: ComEC/Rec2 family competence protein, partial [Acetobacteraceae bacterium]
MRIIGAVAERWLEQERERFVLWLPVFMGAGVLAYYALRFEPPVWVGVVAAVPTVVAGIGWARMRPLLLPAAAAALGFASAQAATARAPPLETGLPRHATTIVGTVRAVESLPAGRRITLGDVRLDGADPALTRLLRVRLRATDPGPVGTGDQVSVRALVRPPPPPAYPGAWDLQRDAFYAGRGGSGFALAPLHRLSHMEPTGFTGFVQRLREQVAQRVAAAIPGAAGAVSVTLLTGAATGIPEADHQAFRDSGLAHLLAVAGLHIGIVMGFAFGVVRWSLALSERASLFWPTRKLAAVAALAAGAGYMVLTGMHVPIVRSFTMACLFTVGLLAGRRAVSLRGLGLAAVVLMTVAPQEVPGVSFQMSFSAVLALISGYEALRPWLRRLHGRSWHRRFASHLVALALTSALAGTASAPYGAYHFGHLQLYFVIANMVAVPLTALWVMPAGLIALPLMPLGLERLALVPMGWGAEVVIWVARTTASWPAATLPVAHMPAWGLAVLSVGLAWVGLWRGRVRLAGLLAIGLGIASPAMIRPPDLLVAAAGRLLAVRTPAGVFFQQAHGGSRFVRDAWMQYWAAGSAQALPEAGQIADAGIVCGAGACLLQPRADASAALLVRGATHPEG